MSEQTNQSTKCGEFFRGEHWRWSPRPKGAERGPSGAGDPDSGPPVSHKFGRVGDRT